MASKPAVKAYNPYAIKKVVGKTSMKFLAAQASAKAVAEVQAEKEKPVLDESIASSRNGEYPSKISCQQLLMFLSSRLYR